MLLLILCPTSLLWFDSFVIAIGQFLGEGNLLLIATYIRYSAHWLMLPLLFIVAGMILRGADFKFASNKYVMGSFYILAVFFIIEDFRHIFIIDFSPCMLWRNSQICDAGSNRTGMYSRIRRFRHKSISSSCNTAYINTSGIGNSNMDKT
ncbi:MAG: hypothetical protein Ct9H300mP4_03380 [Gammaproteobacteria bacterium]|nr:MAG: hypothetical protein Ct9H300mP4_03380 [Gammaproteobacteria bacterium]